MQVMSGPVLAELIETMVGALNARDIPTAGSILEHFNRELVQKAGLLQNVNSSCIVLLHVSDLLLTFHSAQLEDYSSCEHAIV